MITTVKLEGISDVRKFFETKNREVIQNSERGIERTMTIVMFAAKAKFFNGVNSGKYSGTIPPKYRGKTGVMASIKKKIDGKGKTFVVGHVGTIENVSKEMAIILNSVEYGHALPYQGKDTIGKKKSDKIKKLSSVPPHPFMRPALDENKAKFKNIMAEEISKTFK